ncbi:armadillo-type protein [Chytriomyces cf. hyalinus JEL632]|nr:armadillo-type protein [Chytriomyces cf. hyalinus JEL632]
MAFTSADLESLSARAVDDATRLAIVSDADTIAGLAAALNTGDIDLQTAAAKTIAECAKSGNTRKILAEAGLFVPLVRMLGASEGVPSRAIQSLRALANMCFDNEDNRDALLEIKDSINFVTQCLDSTDAQLLKITSGALLNISMDNESVQTEVLACGGAERMIKAIALTTNEGTEKEYGALASSLITTLSNLLEIEKGIEDFKSANGLALLFLALKRQQTIINSTSGLNDDDFIHALEILESIVTCLEFLAENDDVQKQIVAQQVLNVLLDFVDHYPTYTLSQSDLDEDDIPSYDELRRRISRIVTLITMNDSNMANIPKQADVMQRFKTWTTLGLHTGKEIAEDEIRMSGALCIGNLARSDKACTLLVQEHAVDVSLMELLSLEVGRVKAGSASLSAISGAVGDGSSSVASSNAVNEIRSCVKVIHAVVGAFKNLSIAASERKTLGSRGIIQPISELLEIENLQPVHFQCIGVLKNLCAGGNALNSYRIVTGLEPPLALEDKISKMSLDNISSKTPFSRVIRYIWKSTGDNLSGIRNEGGRVVANLIRSAHLAGAPLLVKAILNGNGIPPLVQIVTGALLTRPADEPREGAENEESSHHVHFDAVPSDGQVFPVVQNEGLIALILMSNAAAEAIPVIAKYHASLVPVAKRILMSGLPEENADEGVPSSDAVSEVRSTLSEKVLYSDEIKVNLCLFLGVIASADVTFRNLLAPEIQSILSKLTKWTSVSNLTAASAASEKSAQAFSDAVSKGSSTNILSRTNTKSAKRIVSNDGPSEVGATADSAEEGLRLSDAVKRLSAVFE